MGKAVVIHYEEFSSNRHNTALLADLFEITTNGLKNVGHKIYGNVGGENIVLSGNKPYLLVIAGTDGIGSAAARSTYGSIWYDRPMETTFGANLISDLLLPEVTNNWIKNTYARGANKNDFYVRKYNMSKYAGLSSSLLFSITKPVDMSTEEFNELLDLYGGRENFDVRHVLIKYLEDYLENEVSSTPEFSELLSYLLKSRSYILPSPVYITNDQVPGLLHITKKLLGNWDGCIVPEVSLAEQASSENKSKSDACKLYCSITTLLTSVTRNIFDPEKFIFNLKKLTEIFPTGNLKRDSSTPFNVIERKGEGSLPKVTKLLIPEFHSPQVLAATPYCIEYNSKKILELQSTLDEDSIDYSLLESYFYSLNRLCTVFNSTTYLTRELYKVIEMDLNNSVRWKGSRKEAEIYFASFIYTLKCILKSPKVFKYLLSRGFLSNDARGSSIFSSLYILGETLEKITERKSTLALSKTCKDSLGVNTKFSNSPYGKSFFSTLGHTYLIDPSNTNGLLLLEELVNYLEKVVSFDGVKNSIEHGTQITSSGCLFRIEYVNYSSMYLHDHIFPKKLLKKITNKEIDGLTQRSSLSDIYFLCDYFKDLDFTEGKPFSHYISRICECITILNEVKNCVALKSAESYFLKSSANNYLNHSKWTNLLG